MALLFSMVCLGGVVVAHESPNTKIDELSHRMAAEGPSASLLLERAYEYRALGNRLLAELDLKLALKLEADFSAAYLALGRLYLHDNKSQHSLHVVEEGLSHTVDKAFRAQLHGVEAEAYRQLKKPVLSLASINKALTFSASELNWILLKCAVLKELGRSSERIDTARKAYEMNGSVVLVIEFIDALRDGGEYEECLSRINGYIAKRRYKAEWYLRRAEVHRAMKQEKEVHCDAVRALGELQHRLDASKPAVHLYEDMATAYDLLGDTKARDEVLAKIKELIDL